MVFILRFSRSIGGSVAGNGGCFHSLALRNVIRTLAGRAMSEPSLDHTSKENSSHSQLSARKTQNSPDVSVGGKVKQAGKDAFWIGVVLAGVAVTGLMGYAILRELLSSQSPSGVYSDAFRICEKNSKVQAILGSPVKAYGELGSLRGRRRHVKSAEFLDGNSTIVQLKFYVSGPYNSGTVLVEKDVSESKYRQLIFETDDRRERFSLLEPSAPARRTIF